ncbi:MAG: hypothetical protein U0326_43520 [Polyangiales bacterium]
MDNCSLSRPVGTIDLHGTSAQRHAARRTNNHFNMQSQGTAAAMRFIQFHDDEQWPLQQVAAGTTCPMKVATSHMQHAFDHGQEQPLTVHEFI